MAITYVQLKIYFEEEVQALAQDIFQRSILDEEYASLAGARPGDNVSVSHRYYGKPGKSYIELVMTRPVPVVERGSHNIGIVSAISKDDNGPFLSIQLIKIPQTLRKQGIGSKIIATQVKAVQRLGIQRIVALADTQNQLGVSYNGYYTLPRLGFNASLTEIERQKLPPELAYMQSLEQIMKEQKTRELWFKHGFRIFVTFNTSPNSSSVYTLQNYFKEKGWAWDSIPDTSPQVKRVTTFK